jgi:hypothetical protein
LALRLLAALVQVMERRVIRLLLQPGQPGHLNLLQLYQPQVAALGLMALGAMELVVLAALGQAAT